MTRLRAADRLKKNAERAQDLYYDLGWLDPDLADILADSLREAKLACRAYKVWRERNPDRGILGPGERL